MEWFRSIESVELLQDRGIYIKALIGASSLRERELLELDGEELELEETYADDEGGEDLESSDEYYDSGDVSNAEEAQSFKDDEDTDGHDSADGDDADGNDEHVSEGNEAHKFSWPSYTVEDSDLSRKLDAALGFTTTDMSEAHN